jgi:hypothetical protein
MPFIQIQVQGKKKKKKTPKPQTQVLEERLCNDVRGLAAGTFEMTEVFGE